MLFKTSKTKDILGKKLKTKPDIDPPVPPDHKMYGHVEKR